MKPMGVMLTAFFFGLGCAAAAVPPKVELHALGDGVWVHTSWQVVDGNRVPSNGLLIETGEGLILVDTPWNDAQTTELLRLGNERFGRGVRLAIITHAHEDRIGGIRSLLPAGVRVVSTGMTADMAARAGYPRPEALPSTGYRLSLGGILLELYYPGPGHTRDNAVVWLPKQKILFGGCLIKSTGSNSLGNVADADLPAWPETLRHLLDHFAGIRIVVPGHGPWGGPELIHHTLELLRAPRATVGSPSPAAPRRI